MVESNDWFQEGRPHASELLQWNFYQPIFDSLKITSCFTDSRVMWGNLLEISQSVLSMACGHPLASFGGEASVHKICKQEPWNSLQKFIMFYFHGSKFILTLAFWVTLSYDLLSFTFFHFKLKWSLTVLSVPQSQISVLRKKWFI